MCGRVSSAVSVCSYVRLCAAGTRKLVRQLRSSTVVVSVHDESRFSPPLCLNNSHIDRCFCISDVSVSMYVVECVRAYRFVGDRLFTGFRV